MVVKLKAIVKKRAKPNNIVITLFIVVPLGVVVVMTGELTLVKFDWLP
jgi:hypothetical protein